jgi:hypothetical protein
MKRVVVFALAGLFAASFAAVAYASEFGTPAQAEAMVKKAVSFIKANGTEKGFAEVSNPKGKFIDRDLYVFVYDMNGKCVAHGANQKMIGKDLSDQKDVDGKAYVKERIEIARTKGKGWQDYKFPNPLSKKIEQKTAYLERFEDYIVGCGAYKK